MKKYVGAVVRKSSQLVIDEEIDHSENQISFHKKAHYLDPQKKNETIYSFLSSTTIAPSALQFRETAHMMSRRYSAPECTVISD